MMEDIKLIIHNIAQKIFAEKGYKDTSIADIMTNSGFGVGTFYNYYVSKDKLFAEIMMQKIYLLTKNSLKAVSNIKDPAELIKSMLYLNSEGMMSDPILCQWYNHEVYVKIEKLLRAENGISVMEFLYSDFYKLVKEWQAVGKIRADISCEMIMAIFESIIKIGSHKEEIGIKYFPELQNILTEFVVKGLTDK